MDHRTRGARAERAAEKALRRCGWEILGRNRRIAGVEVDILARRRGRVVAWEVKRRRGDQYPALGPRQLSRLRIAAEACAPSPTVRSVGVGLAVVRGGRWFPRITLRDDLADQPSNSDNSV